MPFDFKKNRAFVAELKREPGYRQALKDAAEEVRNNAVVLETAAHGPWMPPQGNPGQTIVLREYSRGGIPEVIVTNIDHGGHLIEWGSINNPPHAPLRRAVRAAGLKFVPLPKPTAGE
jgi:hypothetical protein